MRVSGLDPGAWTFLIYPLDSTHNAELDFPAFTTNIALFVEDRLTLG
ncbi:MAG: hypothetical protein V3U32_06790 [Anaerolineales bacterium]